MRKYLKRTFQLKGFITRCSLTYLAFGVLRLIFDGFYVINARFHRPFFQIGGIQSEFASGNRSPPLNIPANSTSILSEKSPNKNIDSYRDDWLDPSQICRSHFSFQYGVQYEGADLSENLQNKSVSDSVSCCRLCEQSRLCSHWSFSQINRNCKLKRLAQTAKPDVNYVSGRVSLNKYVLTKVMSTARPSYICSLDELDSPFLSKAIQQLAYNPSNRTL